MDLFFFGLWMLLFSAIPVVCILCAGNKYDGNNLTGIVGKLLIAFFIYLIATVISGTFTLYVIFDYRSIGDKLTATRQIIALSAIYFYGVIGYLICSFINGSLLKPSDLPLFNSKKTQTIFNK